MYPPFLAMRTSDITITPCLGHWATIGILTPWTDTIAPQGNGHMGDGKSIIFTPSVATGCTFCEFRAGH